MTEKVIKAKSQKTEWEDCCVGYICECENGLCLDSQNEPMKCENCGRVYSLVAYVQEHLEE